MQALLDPPLSAYTFLAPSPEPANVPRSLAPAPGPPQQPIKAPPRSLPSQVNDETDAEDETATPASSARRKDSDSSAKDTKVIIGVAVAGAVIVAAFVAFMAFLGYRMRKRQSQQHNFSVMVPAGGEVRFL
jgi:hypothetical protein